MTASSLRGALEVQGRGTWSRRGGVGVEGREEIEARRSGGGVVEEVVLMAVERGIGRLWHGFQHRRLTVRRIKLRCGPAV